MTPRYGPASIVPHRRNAHARVQRWGRRRRNLARMGWPLAFALGLAAPLGAQTLPQGGTVVGGSGTIQQTNPNQLTINQSSQNLAIDWQSFSIGANNIVRFVQPSTSAVALNRVLNGDPSQIYGQIQANGQVVIMSPNGIVFGPNSRVDVNALVATTANISTVDFMSGKLLFDQASGDANARVVNQGIISVAQGGFAVLAAASVSNQGQILATGGTVVLGGTKTFAIDFHGDGLLKFAATGVVDQKPTGADALVENSGSIAANGGRVLMTARAARSVLDNVINTSGIVVAQSAQLVNGEIVIDGGDSGIVRVSGTLDASGAAAGESGGTVKVLGEKVGLFENARIDASGNAGGGTVLVGGNYLGRGPEPNSQMLYMDARAVIDASAVVDGNGGRVILWSDLYTSFQGSISVRGGALGGNGGFVETSSKDNLQVQTGRVFASAAMGLGGTWLLDPHNVTIAGATAGGTYSANVFTPTANNATIDVASIVASLDFGTNVEVNTGSTGAQAGDITLASAINKTAGAGAVLTLNAAGAIVLNSTITGSVGSLGLNLWAGGNIAVNAAISTNNGGISTAGTNGAGNAGGGFTSTATINAGTANVTLNQAGAVSLGGTLTTSGTVTLNAAGATTQTAAIAGGASLVVGGTGAVTLNNAGNDFGSITLSRTGSTTAVSLTTSITPNMQASTLGTGNFSLTGQGFTQAGAITQDAAATGMVTIAGGTGTVTLNQANSFSGDLTVTGGTITVSTAQQTFTNTGAKTASFTQTGTAGSMNLAGIVATSGALSLVANADTQITVNGNITTLGGNITLYGNAPGGDPSAGTSVGNHNGVRFGAGAIHAGGGNIAIAGRGGNSDFNYGVLVDNGAQIETSGAGTLTIDGRGGTGGNNYLAGIRVEGAVLRTQNGALQLTGIGANGTSGNNIGIWISNTSTIETVGTGSVTLTGTGGLYANSHSISIDNSNVTSSGGGLITLQANASAGTGTSLVLAGAAVDIGGASFAGSILVNANSIANTATTLNFRRGTAGGAIEFAPTTGPTDIVFNGTGSGLQLTSAILGAVSNNFSQLNVGGASAGSLTVANPYTIANNKTLHLTANTISLTAGGISYGTSGNGALHLTATAALTVDSSIVAGVGGVLAVNLTSAGAVSLDAAINTGGGLLNVAAGGHITQTVAVNAGLASFTTGSFNIGLTNSANSFNGAVALTTTGIGNVSLNAASATSFGAIAAGGNVAINVADAITFTAPVTVSGASSAFDVTSTDPSAGIVFQTAATVSLAGGSSSLISERGIVVNSAITTAGGSILLLGGSATWATAPSGMPDFTASGTGTFTGVEIGSTGSINAGGGVVAIAGKGGTVGSTNRGVEILGGLATNGSGSILVYGRGGNSSGGLLLTGANGLVDHTGSAVGAVTLNGEGGATGTGARIGIEIASGARVRSANADISLNGIATGTGPGVQLLNGGGTGGVISTGAANIALFGEGTGDILAGGTTSLIGGPSATGSLFLTDAAATTLSGIQLTTAQLQTSGEIIYRSNTPGAALLNVVSAGTIAGTPTQISFNNAGTGDIAFAFGQTLNVPGTNIVFNGANTALDGNLTVSAGNVLTLWAGAGGTFTQNTNANIVAESLVLRGTGNFNLTRNGTLYNTIDHIASAPGVGAVSLRANATIATGFTLLAEAEMDVFGPVSGISATSLILATSGGIGQAAGALVTVTGGGGASFNAGAGGVVLTENGNVFGGTVTVATAGVANLSNSSGTVLGNIAALGGFILQSSGSITQSGGTAISGGGSGSFTAPGNIVLTNAGNNLGTVSLTTNMGGAAEYTDINAFSLGNSNISAGLTLVSGGAFTQTGTVTAGGKYDLTAAGDAVLNTATVGGPLIVDSGGTLSQTGALSVTGNTIITAANSIALGNQSNMFANPITASATGGGLALANTGNTVLGSIASNGVLSVSVTGGSLSQTGAINTSGNATVTLAGANVLTLTQANIFGAALTLTGSGGGSVTGTALGGVTKTAGSGAFTFNSVPVPVFSAPTTNTTQPLPGQGEGGTTVSSAITTAAPLSQLQAAARIAVETVSASGGSVSFAAALSAVLAGGGGPLVAGDGGGTGANNTAGGADAAGGTTPAPAAGGTGTPAAGAGATATAGGAPATGGGGGQTTVSVSAVGSVSVSQGTAPSQPQIRTAGGGGGAAAAGGPPPVRVTAQAIAAEAVQNLGIVSRVAVSGGVSSTTGGSNGPPGVQQSLPPLPR